jgi:phage terminase small subunit
MSNRKIPIEVRKALNIRVRTKLAEIPADLSCRIPAAEWDDNPRLFLRSEFIEETSKFMERVYGFHPSSYQCTLWMLADQMQVYMDATIGFIESGSQIVVSGKENTWLRVREQSLQNILRLSRELGLTPTSRLTAEKQQSSKRDIHNILPYPG